MPYALSQESGSDAHQGKAWAVSVDVKGSYMCKNTTHPVCSMEDEGYQNLDMDRKGPCV